MRSRRRALALAVVVALVAALAWWQLGARVVPAGQPPLATLDTASVAALREDFNRAAGDVRVIVLLSPT
jgi:hypothetical protein